LRRRKIRTIIEATKAMIHDQSLPMTLREKACMTTIYVQNKSPHQILKNITPEEAFTGLSLENIEKDLLGFLPLLRRVS
jgi:hypothetical protein